MSVLETDQLIVLRPLWTVLSQSQQKRAVVLINQSGTTLTHIVLNTDDGPSDLGSLRNGETKRIAINPSNTLTLAYNDRKWHSPDALTAGQSLVIYVTPDLRVTARNKIGTLSR